MPYFGGLFIFISWRIFFLGDKVIFMPLLVLLTSVYGLSLLLIILVDVTAIFSSSSDELIYEI